MLDLVTTLACKDYTYLFQRNDIVGEVIKVFDFVELHDGTPQLSGHLLIHDLDEVQERVYGVEGFVLEVVVVRPALVKQVFGNAVSFIDQMVFRIYVFKETVRTLEENIFFIDGQMSEPYYYLLIKENRENESYLYDI